MNEIVVTSFLGFLLWTDGQDYFHYRYLSMEPSYWQKQNQPHPSLLKIPRSFYYPAIPSEITPASFQLPNKTFIKQYRPIDWGLSIPESMLVETDLTWRGLWTT
ncbi:uncharacterized protein STEHIDRAFT_145749 [Stereum hirsutum FP-91666 SS1]|uniref:uncharacterized protein n=1 Tax=Stereum hirsutum (strain FP-91666) TaxID=721885 RepID=UPI000440BBFC|nr:uncharacterized protein STEHIDRAFT_145749 [Stereum hirsutum FP-91666 SS1]EIM88958.1 hypothetical protein STEHIDRAFT_145749 [Stereum hirsutum FP-91666 SS1]